MAFLKNQTSFIIVLGLMILAAIGVASSYISNPIGFIKGIAVILVVGVVVYFIVKRFYHSNPEKREQRAFIKAAKKSKKRLNHKDAGVSPRRTSSAITTIKKSIRPKKHSNAHLTVIDGKKGKKKNRASF
ncbi:SA1362 family protein [Bacillus sp. DNRA2]|uniref:SA1362 family protein n=1 Tax=Bacillus sp. DNRA2 TaxID=2723053 RepID=UPI0032B860D8